MRITPTVVMLDISLMLPRYANIAPRIAAKKNRFKYENFSLNHSVLFISTSNVEISGRAAQLKLVPAFSKTSQLFSLRLDRVVRCLHPVASDRHHRDEPKPNRKPRNERGRRQRGWPDGLRLENSKTAER